MIISAHKSLAKQKFPWKPHKTENAFLFSQFATHYRFLVGFFGHSWEVSVWKLFQFWKHLVLGEFFYGGVVFAFKIGGSCGLENGDIMREFSNVAIFEKRGSFDVLGWEIKRGGQDYVGKIIHSNILITQLPSHLSQKTHYINTPSPSCFYTLAG